MRDLTQIESLPRLSDGRVVMRPWQADDAPALAEMCNDRDTTRWLPLVPFPYTLADGEAWVGDAARKWREDRAVAYAATDAATGALVGSCGLRIDLRMESAEIGYLVHRGWRRRGIATACVALLSDWALDCLGLGRLQILADVRNVASRRTIAASGYRFEGVLRAHDLVGGERCDDVLHALLPGDPRPWRDPDAARGGLGWPRLTDGRLVVRPFEQDDAPAVRAACADPDIARWIHGLPAPYRLSDAESFIADARHRLLTGERARLAVTDAASGELLASVGLDRFAGRQAAEIGYWVKREARRRGVALAAARLVVAWAFDGLGVERLELLTYPGNEASQALAGKLGFRREGLLRGFLAPEPGKPREGRVVPSAEGSLPPRDDQLCFVRLSSNSPDPVVQPRPVGR